MPTMKRKTKRFKTPTVLQMDSTECGAAALAIVFGFYGLHVPLEQVRIDCGVSRDGSKAGNIVKAARKYGFEAKGFKKEPEDLFDLPLPVILFWNFNHFLVLEGIKDGRYYLNDPAAGPRTVDAEEFDSAFTGVVLTFTPGPDFKKQGRKFGFVNSISNRLSGALPPLVYIILAGLFLVLPGLAIPAFLKIFVDEILIGNLTGWFKPLLLAMGLTALIRGLLTWLQQRCLLRLETRMALINSAIFVRHVFRLPAEFFSQRYGGEIGARIQLNDRTAELLSGELADNFLNLLMAVFFIIVMFYYDVLLTLISLAAALLNFAALKYVSRKRTDLNLRLRQETGKMTGTAMSGLQMIETIKANGYEADLFAKWAGYQAKVANARQDLALPTQLLTILPVLLLSLNTAAILGVGGFRVMEGRLSMGMLVAFQSLMLSFLHPVNRMISLGGKIQEAESDLKRLDDVMKYPADVHYAAQQDDYDENDDQAPARLDGELQIKNLTFGYSRLAPPVIEDFSLTLKPGVRTALVGASGSGKSTVARVVTGLYQPWSGEILFDGQPASETPRSVFTNSVGMVDQDIFLFEGTVLQNLAMWDETIPDNQIIRAARDACVHYDISSRAGGYSSRVEEGGRNFSGGQRQRLEIARALVANPSILILDEATSALDPVLESRIDDNLRRRGCTCLIVAHRLSTIRDCDEIIVLDQGRVVQRGVHDDLINVPGPYAELIRAR